jgi:hypothetical protein
MITFPHARDTPNLARKVERRAGPVSPVAERLPIGLLAERCRSRSRR